MDGRLKRYGRTSKQFKRWLGAHPNADLKRQVAAFDAIADSEFQTVKVKKATTTTRKQTKV